MKSNSVRNTFFPLVICLPACRRPLRYFNATFADTNRIRRRHRFVTITPDATVWSPKREYFQANAVDCTQSNCNRFSGVVFTPRCKTYARPMFSTLFNHSAHFPRPARHTSCVEFSRCGRSSRTRKCATSFIAHNCIAPSIRHPSNRSDRIARFATRPQPFENLR
jgi:hypothetical protein